MRAEKSGIAVMAAYVAASVSAFLLSVLFFKLFYPSLINGDDNATLILSNAIIETRRMFPKDFYYGNDLIFLRSQFAIALFGKLGFSGYQAYAYGCSLMLAVCVPLLMAAFQWSLSYGAIKAFAAAAMLLVPLGYTEYEFMIGQQSHLVQTTLSIIGVLAIVRSRKSAGNFPLAVIFAVSFLIGCDSPLRGALLISIYLAVLLLVHMAGEISRRTLGSCSIAVLAGAALGLLAHRRINVEIVGVESKLTFQPLGLALDRIAEMWGILLDLFFGFLQIAEFHGPGAIQPVFYAKIVATVAFIAICAFLLVSALVRIYRGKSLSDASVVALSGAGLVAAGAIAVGFSHLDLDIRHYLTGLVLLKLSLILFVLELGAIPVIASVATLVLASPFMAPLLSDEYRLSRSKFTQEYDDVIATIGGIVAENGLKKPVVLYGIFENTMIYGLMDSALISAAPIVYNEKSIDRYRCLSRPSSYCRTDDAILAVGPSETVLGAFAARVGRKVGATGKLTFYVVPGNSLSDCPEPQPAAAPQQPAAP